MSGVYGFMAGVSFAFAAILAALGGPLWLILWNAGGAALCGSLSIYWAERAA